MRSVPCSESPAHRPICVKDYPRDWLRVGLLGGGAALLAGRALATSSRAVQGGGGFGRAGVDTSCSVASETLYMTNIIQCPVCQASLHLSDDFVGTAYRCEHCQAMVPLTVKQRDQATAVQATASHTPPPWPALAEQHHRRHLTAGSLPGAQRASREHVWQVIAAISLVVGFLGVVLAVVMYIATQPRSDGRGEGPDQIGHVKEREQGTELKLREKDRVQEGMPNNNDGGVRPEYERPNPPPNQPFAVDPKLIDAKGTVYLNDLQEFAPGESPQGWRFGKNGITGNGFDPGQTISVQGVHYPKGLSMHPPHSGYMRICYALGQRAKTLRGQVAMRDPHTPPTRFVVLGDGKVLWRSPTLKSDQRIPFVIDVNTVQLLELRTYVEGGQATFSNALWLDPSVETTPK